MTTYAITGGTGFFGRHMTRYLLDKSADAIRIISRDEWKQARMRDLINDDRVRYLIGDVRDQQRLERAFQGIDVVIHAAALKRVEVGEYNPSEMVRTNIEGTMNVIRACQQARVSRLVVLSTDKACQPLNAYGATKLVVEKLALAAGAEGGPTAITVTRYGNVAGSTGSIIPTWRRQIQEQGEVIMTDPKATRFWMTAQEACELVDRAMHAPPSALLVPLLPAYDLATLHLAMTLGQAPVKQIGLRPGEKMHEMMISPLEADRFRLNDGIWTTGGGAGVGPAYVSSDTEPRMTYTELQAALQQIGNEPW